MPTLDDWTAAASVALGLEPDAVDHDHDLVLDLARDVAHGVARPAAPLTAYLLGVAVGRGLPPDTAVDNIRDLIGTWPTPTAG